VIIAIAFADGLEGESLKADSGMLCSGLVRFMNGRSAAEKPLLHRDERIGRFRTSSKG
jgi:hypothetical protein